MSKKIVAVSSVGGHWTELMRLRAAFEGCDIVYVTTDTAYQSTVQGERFYTINDFNRKNAWQIFSAIWKLIVLFARFRPDYTISTGAAPGITAILIGRLFLSKTVWVESVANAEELSMSGRIARFLAHRVYVQWPHMADSRLRYRGNVIG